MNEIEKRKKRCCFTGHRPEKLTVDEAELRKGLESAIDGKREGDNGGAVLRLLQFRIGGKPSAENNLVEIKT